jgi:hypothetical protein
MSRILQDLWKAKGWLIMLLELFDAHAVPLAPPTDETYKRFLIKRLFGDAVSLGRCRQESERRRCLSKVIAPLDLVVIP